MILGMNDLFLLADEVRYSAERVRIDGTARLEDTHRNVIDAME